MNGATPNTTTPTSCKPGSANHPFPQMAGVVIGRERTHQKGLITTQGKRWKITNDVKALADIKESRISIPGNSVPQLRFCIALNQ